MLCCIIGNVIDYLNIELLMYDCTIERTSVVCQFVLGGLLDISIEYGSPYLS